MEINEVLSQMKTEIITMEKELEDLRNFKKRVEPFVRGVATTDLIKTVEGDFISQYWLNEAEHLVEQLGMNK